MLMWDPQFDECASEAPDRAGQQARHAVIMRPAPSDKTDKTIAAVQFTCVTAVHPGLHPVLVPQRHRKSRAEGG